MTTKKTYAVILGVKNKNIVAHVLTDLKNGSQVIFGRNAYGKYDIDENGNKKYALLLKSVGKISRKEIYILHSSIHYYKDHTAIEINKGEFVLNY